MIALKHPIPDSALDDRLGFVGTAGSGKSYNAGGCVERLLDRGARVIVVDPLDVWWGLRLIADGSTPSRYPIVVFGGAHGDLSLNEHAGAVLGETVATMSESCIVSLGGLATKAAERRFMLAFLDAIYRKANGEPVHIVFDEADLWAPQKSSEPMLQSRMEEICRRGRIKGLIPWLITQRPAVISKDVLSQVDGLIAFKLTSSQDRDALGAWIEGQADRQQGKEILAALPTMQQGQGVVWVPGRGVLETVAFPPKRTFDSSRTPKRGEKRRSSALPPIDLGALKDRLSAIETETKANDPKELKAEIARLKKQIGDAAPRDDGGAIADAERRGYARGLADGYAQAVKGITAECAGVMTALTAAASQLQHWATQAPANAPTRPASKPEPAPPTVRPTNVGSALPGPHQRIIDAIAWWNAAGHAQPSRHQVAFVAGYKPNTGTFNTYLGALSTSGAIEYPERGHVSLTASGVAYANSPAAKPGSRDLHARINAIISGPQSKLVDALISAYPAPMTRDSLAKASGYQPNTGTFNTYLGSLSTLEIVEYPERGHVRAAEWLFP